MHAATMEYKDKKEQKVLLFEAKEHIIITVTGECY